MKRAAYPYFSSPFNWRRYPLVPLAVAFGLGIGLARSLDFQWLPGLSVVVLLLLLLGLWGIARPLAAETQRSNYSILLLLLAFLLGYGRAVTNHLPNRSDFFAHSVAQDSTATWLLEVNSIRPGEEQLRLTTKVVASIDLDSAQPTAGQLLLYLPPTPKAAQLAVGDRLLVNAAISPIPGPRNPYAFDAAAYWATQSVYHRAFVREDSDWLPSKRAGGGLVRLAEQLRLHWLATFRGHLAGDELAVAAALVLGKRDLISSELQSAYADTGAVHVLAVSGLHVGIIAGMVLGLLSFLPDKKRWARWLRTLLALLAIWSFALLTGLGPSVQRAATMFSILVFAGLSKRRTDLFNSLAAAGLLMLFLQPMQLFQLGFQLSFSAVAGIALFLKPIQRWLFFPWAWQRAIWSVLSVSLAAQLGTLPLSIYYFHQLPLYFLVTGSLVILTAYGALAMGMLHGFFAWCLPFLAGYTGKLLWLVVFVQNSIVHIGAQLPGARRELAWISGFDLLLLLLIVGLFAIFLRWKRFSSLALALLGGLAFLGSRLAQEQGLAAQQSSVFYHVPGKTLVDFAAGHRAFSLADPDLGPRDIFFTAQNHRSARQLDSIRSWWPSQGDTAQLTGLAYADFPVIDALGRRWVLWDGQTSILPTDGSQPPEALLLLADIAPARAIQNLSGNQKIGDETQENNTYQPLIVLDGSCRYATQKMWQSWRDTSHWPVHITAIDGALVLKH